MASMIARASCLLLGLHEEIARSDGIRASDPPMLLFTRTSMPALLQPGAGSSLRRSWRHSVDQIWTSSSFMPVIFACPAPSQPGPRQLIITTWMPALAPSSFACRTPAVPQMAAAFLRRRAGDAVEVRSAGTSPAAEFQPDGPRRRWPKLGRRSIGDARSWCSRPTLAEDADVVNHDGLRRRASGAPREAISGLGAADPAGKPIDEVRVIRDDIDRTASRDLVAGDLTAVRLPP